jgi:hypothetical protein
VSGTPPTSRTHESSTAHEGAVTGARRARWRLVAIGLVAGGVLAVGGVWASSSLFVDDADQSATGGKGGRAGSPGPTSSPGGLTPASGRPISLEDPERRTSSGVSSGFGRGGLGATSAAVRHWQELDLLDDERARRQLKDMASARSPEVVDQGLSEVRRARELAGDPGSIASITTDVRAMRNRSLDDAGDVVEVWLAFDRFPQVEDGADRIAPAKGETRSVILIWENGDWKHTAEKRWTNRGTSPRAFDPDSPSAWTDGWRRVAGG